MLLSIILLTMDTMDLENLIKTLIIGLVKLVITDYTFMMKI
nr:MAG TPA: hypothetical protein [Caudoviricetes sp.]